MEILEILKAISDENRMRILNLLRQKNLCVGEIQTILGISQPNASKHLNKLKASSIIEVHKKGQTSYHYINEENLSSIKFLNTFIYDDLENKFPEDDLRLKKYISSGLTCEDLKNLGFDLSEN